MIDTPGFFGTDESDDIKLEILRCMVECAPGPHAFVFVLKVEKYAKQERDVIKEILTSFSDEALKYSTVVFTRGDELSEGMKIEDCVHQNEPLADLVKKCGGRCHVIDSKYWNEKPKDEYRSNQLQVEELLESIEKMVKENDGSCFTNEILQELKKEEEREMKKGRLESGNLSEEEIEEQAKDRVLNKFWIRLAGLTTGALLGAFYGAALPAQILVLIFTYEENVKEIAKEAKTALGIKDTVKAVTGGATIVAGAAERAAAMGGRAAVAEGVTAATGSAVASGAAEGAAAGGASAGGASAVVKGAAAVTLTCASVGAFIGGVKGFNAAEEAKTAGEAAEKAAEAVNEGAESIKQFILKKTDEIISNIKKSK